MNAPTPTPIATPHQPSTNAPHESTQGRSQVDSSPSGGLTRSGRSGGAFRHRLRVYWEDTDAGGIVFYGNHLKFFERARTEWLRDLGFSQQRLRIEQGVLFVVAETALRYRMPAHLDDLLDITVRVVEAQRASMRIEQQAWRGELLLAEGDIRIGCVKVSAHGDGTLRPCRIPETIALRIEKHA